jgi:uncharacterized membrane protein
VATLTVWKFPTAQGAEQAQDTLEGMAKQELITIVDAAVVTWPEGAKKPKTRELRSPTAGGALGGAFWGMLFGLIFFVPLLGMAIGAGMGALAGSLTDVGIDDDFIKSVRGKVSPGTSALFVLSSNAVVEKVQAAFAGQHAELLQTNLSNEQEAALRRAFEEE